MATPAFNEHDGRLPTNVKPSHYDLAIYTDLDNLVFTGVVNIRLDVLNDADTIVLNSDNLTIQDVRLHFAKEQVSLSTEAIKQDPKAGRLTLNLPTTLAAGSKGQLRLTFRAKLTDGMMGYYFSRYELDGQKKCCTLTQFEPISARSAFPCWDEPLLKATFDISMVSAADTVNLSNMPAIAEATCSVGDNDAEAYKDLFSDLNLANEHGKRVKITKFERTPPMSTYLAAFANGHFSHLESEYTSPLSGKTRPLRIYATRDVIHLGQYALDIKAKVLPIYEKVFDIEFPLPKLDTLLVQNFDAGAMENWGLITARQMGILLDPARSDFATRKRATIVQSHECAHMWFGNIVTMAWWDNLWLNEGFASLMGEVVTINRIFPEWKADTEFINDHLARALLLDAKRSSHPIEVPIENAETINQIFDDLSYSKAASMLRMLMALVGEAPFLKGVSIYLKKRLFGNSVTKDLWDGIAEATGIDIPQLMDNWTLKIGYPVLTVTETASGITVRQNRFLDTGDVKETEDTTLWQIPLQILTVDDSAKTNIDSKVIMRAREESFAVNTLCTYKLNANTTGVYRVSYPPARWIQLGEEAARENSRLSTEDCMGLVSDAFVLAQAGLAKTSSALDFVQGLSGRDEHLLWSAMTGRLSGLMNVWWEQGTAWDQLNDFRRAMTKPLVDKLGFEYSPNDSIDTTQLRSLAITQACLGDDDGVVERLKTMFQQLKDSGDDSHIPPDLLRICVAAGVHHGGPEEFATASKLYLEPASTPAMKFAAIGGICAVKESCGNEAIAFLQKHAQQQDVVYFFRLLASNKHTRRMLSQFVMSDYDELSKTYDGTATWNYMISAAFTNLSSDEDHEKVYRFFEHRDTSKFHLALSQSLDSIKTSSEWLKRGRSDVDEWLLKRRP